LALPLRAHELRLRRYGDIAKDPLVECALRAPIHRSAHHPVESGHLCHPRVGHGHRLHVFIVAVLQLRRENGRRPLSHGTAHDPQLPPPYHAPARRLPLRRLPYVPRVGSSRAPPQMESISH
jgi:hypothetical protein